MPKRMLRCEAHLRRLRHFEAWCCRKCSSELRYTNSGVGLGVWLGSRVNADGLGLRVITTLDDIGRSPTSTCDRTLTKLQNNTDVMMPSTEKQCANNWSAMEIETILRVRGCCNADSKKESYCDTSGSLSKNNSLRLTPQQSLRRLGLCSQVATGQHSSPIVFPEKRGKVKASRRGDTSVNSDDLKKAKREEHRIDIGDEQSDLLGYEVFSGKLVLDKRKTNKNDDTQTSTEILNQDAVDAKLTSKALVWGSHVLCLEDVSYNVGIRHFTIHAYTVKKGSCGLSCFMKTGRSRKDFRFLAFTSEEAVQWVTGFADQQCFVNCLPHPLKQASEMVASDFPYELRIKWSDLIPPLQTPNLIRDVEHALMYPAPYPHLTDHHCLSLNFSSLILTGFRLPPTVAIGASITATYYRHFGLSPKWSHISGTLSQISPPGSSFTVLPLLAPFFTHCHLPALHRSRPPDFPTVTSKSPSLRITLSFLLPTPLQPSFPNVPPPPFSLPLPHKSQ
ncbi:hypothetical protein TEA_006004 [Camellia sinensis var. sinensis]|uniref:Uncharacterized protein n=1 Tax=Camellia sinensis var. sinensis TaxID=542762 RepID=A0A4S4D7V0_CAMSN|nr:hypothetical protein TEA_006004 [Camellia sinensis var. sinensis]